ncbi:hypothetical protein J8L88_09875 [Aquimarina sp. MMG015]|uniref:hypothetical protein n=1 Tax=unclassified Aquimarina TaxID=2627091 RepID=UPI001B3A076E|nr:hypothetical protein [Aquimarina sp. MMG015]MBQ4803156.1 hypothetical protein [Aquimarina sp. MMG015]
MKNLKSFFLITLLAIITFFYACNDEFTASEKEVVLETTLKKEGVLDRLSGTLQTTNNKPIDNATIKLKGKIIGISDAEGSFILKENSFSLGDVLTIEHQGFVTVSKVIEENTKLFVLMKERAKAHVIDSKKGAEISVASDGQITIPPNAFSYKGKPYSGLVEIRATYIDITNQLELRSAPGSYIAENEEDGTLYPLTSFGMIEITATIPEENIPLDLAEGVAIDTSFPIRTENTPEQVNLYELNRDTGYWDISGVLINQGNVLRGEITSVNSSWNADDPCANALVCVRVQVVYTNGDPGCYVWATGLTYNGFSGHFTPDANGFVEFWVCPDSVFQLNACLCLCIPGGPIHTSIIDLSTVTMNPSGCTDLGVWTINN